MLAVALAAAAEDAVAVGEVALVEAAVQAVAVEDVAAAGAVVAEPADWVAEERQAVVAGVDLVAAAVDAAVVVAALEPLPALELAARQAQGSPADFRDKRQVSIYRCKLMSVINRPRSAAVHLQISPQNVTSSHASSAC